MLLVKYDTAGNFQWLRLPEIDTLGGADRGVSYRMDIDENGLIHWFCYLRAGVHDWTNNNVIAEDGCYVLVYNGNGDVVDVKQLEIETDYVNITGQENLENFTYDPLRKRYYIAGTYTNMASSQMLVLGGDTIKGSLYIAAFDSIGQHIWSESGGQFLFLNNNLTGLTVDEDGDVYVCGGAVKDDSISGYVIKSNAPTSLPVLRMSQQPFILKYDENGNLIWGNNGVSSNGAPLHSIKVIDDEVYGLGNGAVLHWYSTRNPDTLNLLQGVSPGRFYIARFMKNTGELYDFHFAEDITGGTLGFAIENDDNNDIYLGGRFRNSVVFGLDTLSSPNENALFLTKFLCDPFAGFTYSYTSGSSLVEFNYTGSQYDTIIWDFGGGNTVINDTEPSHVFSPPGKYEVCLTVINTCGSTQLCDTIDNRGLSTEKLLTQNGPHIYPNPSSDYFHVENLKHIDKYTMYNASGITVREQTLNEATESTVIDAQGLTSGAYFLRFNHQNGDVIVKRVVVF